MGFRGEVRTKKWLNISSASSVVDIFFKFTRYFDFFQRKNTSYGQDAVQFPTTCSITLVNKHWGIIRYNFDTSTVA